MNEVVSFSKLAINRSNLGDFDDMGVFVQVILSGCLHSDQSHSINHQLYVVNGLPSVKYKPLTNG
jgi:hypothetical protein